MGWEHGHRTDDRVTCRNEDVISFVDHVNIITWRSGFPIKTVRRDWDLWNMLRVSRDLW